MLDTGQVIADRYELLKQLGRGGFSEVWLALDKLTDVKVAIKIYAPGMGLDDAGISLFTQEFSLVFDINHTNLLHPTYYDCWERMPYLILPFCKNGSIFKYLTDNNRITETESWHLLHDVAEGLAYLHAKLPPVIHQDIKPDNILINVKQKTALDYDGIILPKKLTQDDTATMEVNLMNTGKSAIRNAKISFDIDGLETGGVLFIGEIKAGESKTGSANFQVSSSKLGDVKGTATLSYEDDFGKSYSESISLSSTIIKKKAVKSDSDMDKKKSKFSLWWLFLLIGLAIGGGVGAIIPISINQSKKRKEDDLRL